MISRWQKWTWNSTEYAPKKTTLCKSCGWLQLISWWETNLPELGLRLLTFATMWISPLRAQLRTRNLPLKFDAPNKSRPFAAENLQRHQPSFYQIDSSLPHETKSDNKPDCKNQPAMHTNCSDFLPDLTNIETLEDGTKFNFFYRIRSDLEMALNSSNGTGITVKKWFTAKYSLQWKSHKTGKGVI